MQKLLRTFFVQPLRFLISINNCVHSSYSEEKSDKFDEMEKLFLFLSFFKHISRFAAIKKLHVYASRGALIRLNLIEYKKQQSNLIKMENWDKLQFNPILVTSLKEKKIGKKLCQKRRRKNLSCKIHEK